MSAEREKTLEGLRTAVRMETDGKEFYLQASRESKNEMGKKLLNTLASEEDYHKKKFEEIYSTIEKNMGWPQTNFVQDGGKTLRTVFSDAMDRPSTEKEALHTEIDTVQKAMEMESAARDFYKKRIDHSTHVAEKQFYTMVADEEREHFLVLLDYFEYLKDPAGWFVDKEHPSVDG
ncbi:MAG: ferritin family protein [Dehalococcoidales bacterium]|nr:ferritin family protein [Dehalococcoidales bacterium]